MNLNLRKIYEGGKRRQVGHSKEKAVAQGMA